MNDVGLCYVCDITLSVVKQLLVQIPYEIELASKSVSMLRRWNLFLHLIQPQFLAHAVRSLDTTVSELCRLLLGTGFI